MILSTSSCKLSKPRLDLDEAHIRESGHVRLGDIRLDLGKKIQLDISRLDGGGQLLHLRVAQDAVCEYADFRRRIFLRQEFDLVREAFRRLFPVIPRRAVQPAEGAGLVAPPPAAPRAFDHEMHIVVVGEEGAERAEKVVEIGNRQMLHVLRDPVHDRLRPRRTAGHHPVRQFPGRNLAFLQKPPADVGENLVRLADKHIIIGLDMLDQRRAEIAHAVRAAHHDKRRIFLLLEPTGQRDIRIRLLEHRHESHDLRLMSHHPRGGFLHEVLRVPLPIREMTQPLLRHLDFFFRRAAQGQTNSAHPFDILVQRTQRLVAVRRPRENHLADKEIAARQRHDMIKPDAAPMSVLQMLIINH